MSKTTKAFEKLYEEHVSELTRLLHKIPAFADAFRELQAATNVPEFEVQIPADILERLKKGTAYLAQRKEDGFLTAIIFDSKTKKFIKQVGLSEKSPELVSPKLLSSLNQVATQSALAEISKRLVEIDQKLDTVIQGQRDDRMGLIDSAETLYYLAALAQDGENRRQLLISAIAQSSEGRGRLIREVRTRLLEVENLPETRGKIFVSGLTRDINKDARDKAKLLETALEGVLKATYLMAFSCAELDEPLLFKESWQPVDELMPGLTLAKDKIALWLPDDPTALPDSFGTLVSAATGIVETGKRLESGTRPMLSIKITLNMLVDGEA